jgi:pyruvate dehydrogenase E1 component alpha subunit
MCDTHIARRVTSYGMRSEQLDGNDVLAVHAAANQAVADCRAGHGPVFLELLTYRITGHSRRDPCHYQPQAERAAWATSDPLTRLGDLLERQGLADTATLAAIRERVVAAFQHAVHQARQAPLPTVQDLVTDVLV